MFNDEFISELVQKISPTYKPNEKALQADLRDLAYDYLAAACSAPFGIGGGPKKLSRDERRRFLQTHVVNPAGKLLDALAKDNAHFFFEWTDEKTGPNPNRDRLIQELEHLVDRVTVVVEGLEERANDGTDALTEFKLDFANALRMEFKKHYPTLPSHVSAYDRAERPASEYFNFLRMCSKEIFKGELVLAVELVDSVTEPKRKR